MCRGDYEEGLELKLKFLIIGLGSMGRRRIRCLNALNEFEVAGFDVNRSRVDDVMQAGVRGFDSVLEAVHVFQPDVFVISTPPKFHLEYARMAVELGIDCFIEASVVDGDHLPLLSKIAKLNDVLCLPSCTMKYFRGPQEVERIVKSGVLGKIYNVTYQTGQYLPDWHPWESIRDYYVSERESGGCREIVPFELTWINGIFGVPEPIHCYRSKVSAFEADIDDIYHILLRYPQNIHLNMTVEVLSRPVASREMRIIGSEGRLIFDGELSNVRFITTSSNKWENIDVSEIDNFSGSINPEGPYVRELTDFISSIRTRNPSKFPNDLDLDSQVLRILSQLDSMSNH